MSLVDALLGDPNDGQRTPALRSGVVTSVSPLLVRVGAASTAQPANALAAYAPVVGDVVQVLVVDGDRLVLGVVSTWQPITSGFASSSGGVNLGSTGVVTGRYARGQSVTGWMRASWDGIGGASGSGYYQFTLPVAARNEAYLLVGSFKAYSTGGNMIYGALELDNLSSTVARCTHAATSNGSAETMLGGGSGLGNTGPAFVVVQFDYEPA